MAPSGVDPSGAIPPERLGPWLALPALVVALVHGPTFDNFLYTHDGWNDVQLGENLLEGNLGLHENLLRLIPTLSFGLRALVGLEMWAWHLPNLLLHAANATLVTWLACALRADRVAALAAGALFASAPLLSHPVEWVGGGYDLFATFGMLLAVRGVFTRSHLVAAIGTLLALLSKEVGATTIGVVFCTLAARDGLPKDVAGWRAWLRWTISVWMVTATVAGLRVAQVVLTDDPFAGRAVEPAFGEWLAAAPAALGFSGFGALADVLGQRDPAGLEGVGFALFAALVALVAARRQWATAGWLALAGAGALLPVSLIAMGLEEMLQNPRYLYVTAALTAPIVPMACGGTASWARAVLAALLVISLWTGFDRSLKSRGVTAAVKPVAEAVLNAPDGSRVWVFAGFYDEPTARFLMSQWLSARRGIRAGYVMRGQQRVFVRLGDAQTDAAQAYFKPLDLQVRPARTDLQVLQVMGKTPRAEIIAWSAPPTARSDIWETVDTTWTPIPPSDPGDPLPEVEDGVLQSPHFLGPVASANLRPLGAIELPEAATGIELTLVVQSDAQSRYASGYHERFGAVFFGPQWDPRSAMSFEVENQTTEPQVVRLTWEGDPAVPSAATQIGLLPLNYPGTITVKQVRLRRAR